MIQSPNPSYDITWFVFPEKTIKINISISLYFVLFQTNTLTSESLFLTTLFVAKKFLIWHWKCDYRKFTQDQSYACHKNEFNKKKPDVVKREVFLSQLCGYFFFSNSIQFCLVGTTPPRKLLDLKKWAHDTWLTAHDARRTVTPPKNKSLPK